MVRLAANAAVTSKAFAVAASGGVRLMEGEVWGAAREAAENEQCQIFETWLRD